MKYLGILFSILSFFFACHSSQKNEPTNDQDENIHFTITDSLAYTIIQIKKPFVGSNVNERYLLYPKGSEEPVSIPALHRIPIPVENIAINSTTHLGFLSELNQDFTIKAASNLNLYYNKDFQNRVNNGNVISIGDRSINKEKLIKEEVDLLFNFAIDASAYKEVEQLRKLNQKVVLISEYMEQNPLEKAEWIKMVACFFDAETRKRADSIYNQVAENYYSIQTKAKQNRGQPTVTIGLPWKGTWYVSGGNSFQAKLIEDANANYIWSDYKQEASVPLDIETVYSRALDADYWINPGIVLSKTELKDRNSQFSQFKSFRENNVFTNYLKSNSYGANDYWESAVVRPDLILEDLVHIFHGEEDNMELLNYYKKLEE